MGNRRARGAVRTPPAPFYFLLLVVVVALLLAIALVEETLPYVHATTPSRTDGGEAEFWDSSDVPLRDESDVSSHDQETAESQGDSLPFRAIVKRATFGDRTLFAAAQAGHVENFVDTLVWIALPLYLVAQGLDTAGTGIVVGIHSGMYFLQIYTGRLGDRIGRKPPIVVGMFVAGVGVLGLPLVDGYPAWILLSGVSGLGMALHYPNLIAVASDAAHPRWCSTGLGVYRLWRDLGYAVGALAIGLAVDFGSIHLAFYGAAIAMFLSGSVVVLLMEETHPEFGTHECANR